MCRWLAYTGSPILLADVLYTPAHSLIDQSLHSKRSLFFSRDVRAVRQLYPDREKLSELSDDARLVVSEPIGDLPGAWNEMPEAHYGVVGKGDDQLRPFAVKPPSKVL